MSFNSFHPEVLEAEVYMPETVPVTADECGEPLNQGYTFTRVCGWSWKRNKGRRGFTRVVNNLPFGYAEAVDLPEAE